MIDQVESIRKKASYFIIGVVMWEFFSYFGMQALLILYLTQKLHFSDSAAFAIFGSFTSMIFITPIIGGWLADRYCGYRHAVLYGCMLIVLGHLALGSTLHYGLYSGLSLLVLGIGLFKSNAICLISECYPNDQVGKSMAFTWYYVSGNLGSIGSQIMCPYLAQYCGWHIAFVAAAFGMVFGLIMLLMSRKYFQWHKECTPSIWWRNLNVGYKTSLSIGILLAGFFIVYFVLDKLLVGYLLAVIIAISALMFANIYKQTTPERKRALRIIVVLTAFATSFWVFDMQGSSSVSLFIARYINRNIAGFIIPAGAFQAINPTVILMFGAIMAWIWRYLGRKNIKPTDASKLSIAILFLALGFFFIAISANIVRSENYLAPMFFPVLSLVIVGCAEMFVDPVLLAAITEAAPAQSEGRLVAMYYLAVGAIANYLAAKVANLTIDPTTESATASTYYHAYVQILQISLVIFVMLFIFAMVKKRKKSAFVAEKVCEQE